MPNLTDRGEMLRLKIQNDYLLGQLAVYAASFHELTDTLIAAVAGSLDVLTELREQLRDSPEAPRFDAALQAAISFWTDEFNLLAARQATRPAKEI
jgi:hypothetical protein